VPGTVARATAAAEADVTMAAARATLACLLAVASTLRQAGALPATLLYVCQNGQCVPSARGLPLSECEAVCAPPPSANYTCQSGQCVISGRAGLPKAECTQVCGGPRPVPPPPPPPPIQFICQVGFCIECTGDECLSKADCAQACGSTSIVARAKASPDLSTFVAALKASSVNETDGGSDDLVNLLAGGLGNEGPFTVFAPTNEAFSNLPAGVLANLLKPENKAALNNVRPPSNRSL
jgi:hypothetical protein